MGNAAARGASPNKEAVQFTSTVVDVDRRSPSYSLIVSWCRS
jgi:hypothetical protein